MGGKGGKATSIKGISMTKKKLYQILEEAGIKTCEVKLDGCTNNLFLTPAHRHKRLYYKNRPKLLWDISQVVIACTHCHNRIEHDKNLTAVIFNTLRGAE